MRLHVGFRGVILIIVMVYVLVGALGLAVTGHSAQVDVRDSAVPTATS